MDLFIKTITSGDNFISLFYSNTEKHTSFVIAILITIITYLFLRYVVLTIIRKIVRKTTTKWDDMLFEKRVFNKGILLIPGLMIHSSAQYTLSESPASLNQILMFTQIYLVIVTVLILNSFLDAMYQIYKSYEVSKSKPVKGYLQVFKMLSIIIATIIIFSTLLNKSPILLLGGLGAFSAVLLLIFKDPILGFVAGIQISVNDMVRQGDWIVMDKTGADGLVTDISLTTVKVQNWDKTISTLPTYSLVSESFVNWRGMKESGGRRIKRSINIDMNSVKFMTTEQLERLKRINLISDFLDRKEKELTAYNKKNNIDNEELVNGRRQTNLGIFRIYVSEYLSQNPNIHKNMTFLVRQLQPTVSGIPIEIYAFSKVQEWAKYEDLQSDIFDHLLAAIPEFELQVFQNPSGVDFGKLYKHEVKNI